MAVVRPQPGARLVVGRYVVGPKIAGGGMATVHLGRQRGGAGFARTVAIKRLLPELAKDPEFVARFVEEARIASRIRHANVVPTLDVVDEPEVLLVLEYVHGESLSCLQRTALERGERCPPPIASAIIVGVLRGLHVAHRAKGANGTDLELVHRDVSPQNVIVGADGVPRVLDFGIAKAAGREQSTLNKGGSKDLRGKLAYMAPEQIAGEPLDRRADLFAAGVILWETLASERLFKGDDPVQTMKAIFHREPPALANDVEGVSARVDEVLATALAKDVAQRYSTADEMARAIEIALPPASDREVAEWVEKVAADRLAARTAVIADFEGSTDGAEEDEPEDPHDPTTLKRGVALLPPALANAAPPIRTPMSMVSPVVDPLAKSGMTETRVGPIDFEARRPKPFAPPRTPIPMPMEPAKPRMSLMQVAALVLVPPAVAALSLLVIRPATFTSAAPTAPVVVSEVASPPPPPEPAAAPPPPVAKVIEPTSHPAPPAASHAPHHPRVVPARLPRRR